MYGIVKQNQGNVWLYSEEGRGTTFKVYLPRIGEAKPLSATPPAAKKMPVGDETILLVEDDPGVRELISQVLLRQGYHVLTAQHGEEALELAADYTGPLHLLITDVVMPGMSGKMLAEQLVQSRPGLKVIFMSGYTDETIMQHGELDPNLAFMQKPFSPIAMTHKIREVLGSGQ